MTVNSYVSAYSGSQIDASVAATQAADMHKNASAATGPTSADDSSLGFSAGSRWFNTTTGVLSICHSAAIGAAVWVDLVDVSSAQNLDAKIIGASVPAAANVTSLNGGPLAGLRNRLINGGMNITQRGTSFTAPASGSYTLDRWRVQWTGAAFASVAQVAGPSGYGKAIQITGAAGNTSGGLSQLIESINCSDLVGQSVVFGANLAASTAQTVGWTLSYANAVDNFSAVTTISSGTWSVGTSAAEFAAAVTNLPAGAANGLQLLVSPNNGAGLTSGTLTATGLRFSRGVVDSPFEFRPPQLELALCMRYFEPSCQLRAGQGSVNAYLLEAVNRWQVTKRVSPNITFYDAAGNPGKVTTQASGNNLGFSVGSVYADWSNVWIDASLGTGGTVGNWFYTSVTGDAEL